MARRILLVFLFLSSSDLFASEPQPQYTTTRSLPALKMSFREVQQVLDKTAHLVADANAKAAQEAKEAKGAQELLLFFQASPRETLTLGTGPDEIQIDGHSFPPTAHLPKAAYALRYSYSWSNAPVSKVDMDFDDFRRRLAVSGKAADQVDAISAALERYLSQHSTFGVSTTTRGFLGSFIFFALLFGLVVSGINSIVARQWRYIGVPIFCLLGLILLFTLPFKDLLAGFAVYQGETSWMVRYEPQFAFAGLIIAIAGIVLSFFIPKWLSK